MGRFGIKNLVAVILVVVGTIILAGQSLTPVEQVTDPDASALHLSDQTTEFLLAIGAIILLVIGIGVGLAVVLWLVNREVKTAQVMKNEPANPLDYRSYGHALAVILPVSIAAAMLVFLLTYGLLPEQAGAEAQTVDHVFKIEFIGISVIFGLVMGLLIHSVLYFRATDDDRGDGKYIHGNWKLETFWTVIPLIFVMTLGVYTAFKLDDISKEKEGEIGVRVEGFQWGWRFYYPTELFFTDEELLQLDERQQADIIANGGVQVGELVMLMDQTVRLEMSSVDVIHSFWVPEMRLKRDVVPGITTEMRYTAILPGTYRVRCAEICGLNHWQMYANVVVVDQAGYDAWIERTKAGFGDPVVAGQTLYESQCITCHSIDGTAKTGPSWQNVIGYEREFDNGSSAIADYDYIEQSIWSPNTRIVDGFASGVMPENFSNSISQVQAEQIFAYMCTLSDRAEEVEKCVELLAQQDESGEDDVESSEDSTEASESDSTESSTEETAGEGDDATTEGKAEASE